ncbi:hypothetical protein ACUW9Z_000888 [Aerococcus sp. 150760007-1]|uniref:Rho termination factor N-terminal domain-containing protein n=1 Tax=Aerococcus urinaeequi TaxID=51665 RepID=A0ABR5ZXW6_9LACT|nr:Rho termination factor N-terminal domain-containing protein [Aerococcus urinaeequi]MBA5746580.1 Rho termination factor N-terminal domain-containing protein [Aerococcus urinaeequi]MBA5829369.1 Rho termination factor N-terminal domain-containing protein [Aerococcus urinaeequi]MBA5860268.1 Rho termination factor N-terminal domain-containing protein [Aerococcus urinaeequi]
MKFKNTKTGVVIDLTAPISGGNWVAFGEVEETKPTPKYKPEVKVEQKVEEVETDDFDLTKMTVDELKDYAVDNDIELTATKKAEIIEEIAKAFEM